MESDVITDFTELCFLAEPSTVDSSPRSSPRHDMASEESESAPFSIYLYSYPLKCK